MNRHERRKRGKLEKKEAVRLMMTNLGFSSGSDLSQEDVVSIGGITMHGIGLGPKVRECLAEKTADILARHGPEAFETPKEATAIHEAGHVVINSVLGLETTEVYIEQVDKVRWIGWTHAPGLELAATLENRASPDRLIMQSRAALAGIMAEGMFASPEDRREGSSLDEIIASQLIASEAAERSGINHNDGMKMFWHERVWRWCGNQLRHNWEVHAEITEALMVRERIEGEALRELCGRCELYEPKPPVMAVDD
jgi:hypothetical protein